MAALPPWLQISPMDYLRAVEAGTQAGLSIRQANERAWESAQRMQMEQEAQQQHAQQLAVENMQNRLAQENLNRYRQQEAATAAHRASVADANEKAMQAFREAEVRETGRHNLASEQEKSTAATQAEEARRLGLDIRERGLRDTEERNKSAEERAKDRLEMQTRLNTLNEQLKQAQLDKAANPIIKTIKGKDYQWDQNTQQWVLPKIKPTEPSPPSTLVPDLIGAAKLGLGLNPFNAAQPAPATNSAAMGSIPVTPVRSQQNAAPKRFKDKSGKTFRYTGDSQDPKTDKDPSHWVEE